MIYDLRPQWLINARITSTEPNRAAFPFAISDFPVSEWLALKMNDDKEIRKT